MSTTFELARVGDKVWSFVDGWGTIIDTGYVEDYPISVRFDKGDKSVEWFTTCGKTHTHALNPTLFWDEIKFEIPKKPLPELEVDTKVLVWNVGSPKHKRHFSHFSPSGKIVCFVSGMTSWTTVKTSEWDEWELAELQPLNVNQ